MSRVINQRKLWNYFDKDDDSKYSVFIKILRRYVRNLLFNAEGLHECTVESLFKTKEETLPSFAEIYITLGLHCFLGLTTSITLYFYRIIFKKRHVRYFFLRWSIELNYFSFMIWFSWGDTTVTCMSDNLEKSQNLEIRSYSDISIYSQITANLFVF